MGGRNKQKIYYTKSKRRDSHARVHSTGMSWARFQSDNLEDMAFYLGSDTMSAHFFGHDIQILINWGLWYLLSLYLYIALRIKGDKGFKGLHNYNGILQQCD